MGTQETLSFILFAIAASFNAVMDTLKFHFESSIFSKKNPRWWNPNESCNYVKFLPFTKYRPDAWHLSKSMMIVIMCLSVVFYKPAFGMLIDFLILGCVWNGVFNILYNHVLKMKVKK